MFRLRPAESDAVEMRTAFTGTITVHIKHLTSMRLFQMHGLWVVVYRAAKPHAPTDSSVKISVDSNHIGCLLQPYEQRRVSFTLVALSVVQKLLGWWRCGRRCLNTAAISYRVLPRRQTSAASFSRVTEWRTLRRLE